MSSKERAHSNSKESTKQRLPKPATENSYLPVQQQAQLAPIIQQARLDPRSLSPQDVLRLQRTVGNRAVGQLLTGIGPRPVVQPKLVVGPVGDSYEQEADRVAAQVMSMPGHAPKVQRMGEEEEEEIQAKPLAATITPLVQRAAAPEEEEELQAKSTNVGDSFEPSADFESRLAFTRGGGNPLPKFMRAFMEPRFGAEFSGVRVHTDTQSDQLNRSIQAKAFTTGQDVFFRQGAYEPGSQRGQELIAHELTHVVQQGGQAVRRRYARSISQAPAHVVQRKFGFEIELGMLLTTEKTLKKFPNGPGMEQYMTDPKTTTYPIVAKGNGFEVHVDHRGTGIDPHMQRDPKGAGTEPKVWARAAPIAELVTSPPMDEFKMTEAEVRTVMRHMKTFADEAKANTTDFTRRSPVLPISVINEVAGDNDTYIGSEWKGFLNPTRGDIQMTQGVRLDRLGEYFAKKQAHGGHKATTSMTEAQTMAGGIVDWIVANYRDPKRKSTGAKRWFANWFAVPGTAAELADLKGFLTMIAYYLRQGQNAEYNQWCKNFGGGLFYKNDLAQLRNAMNPENQLILNKRAAKVKAKLLTETGRGADERVVFKEVGTRTKGSRTTVGEWLEEVLNGRSDPLFGELKNAYAKAIPPGQIGPEDDKHLAAVIENRDAIASLVGGGGADPDQWEDLGAATYNYVRAINIGEG